MMAKQRTSSVYQRNAFAPGLLAAAVLFLAPVLMGGDWFTVVLFVAAIFAVMNAMWLELQRDRVLADEHDDRPPAVKD